MSKATPFRDQELWLQTAPGKPLDGPYSVQWYLDRIKSGKWKKGWQVSRDAIHFQDFQVAFSKAIAAENQRLADEIQDMAERERRDKEKREALEAIRRKQEREAQLRILNQRTQRAANRCSGEEFQLVSTEYISDEEAKALLKNQSNQYSTNSPPPVAAAETDLFTSLVTGGFVLLLIFMFVCAGLGGGGGGSGVTAKPGVIYSGGRLRPGIIYSNDE